MQLHELLARHFRLLDFPRGIKCATQAPLRKPAISPVISLDLIKVSTPMRKATRISLALGTSAALLSLSALPASAADDDGTTFTAEVPVGTLAISTETPAAVDPMTFMPGERTTFTIPKVTVSDTRAGTDSWAVDVSMTNFVSEAKVISTVGATYSPETPVLNSAAGTAVPVSSIGNLVEGDPSNNAPGVVVAGAVAGNNNVSWAAELSVLVPATALKGTYAAVLTHSVL